MSAAGARHRPGFLIPGPTPTSGVPPVRYTNTDYLPATLRTQALSELASSGPPHATQAAGALLACVMIVAGSDSPVFVDLARYQGKPATVIVAQDHAWVTSRGCNATQHHVLDSVSLSGG